MSIKVNERSKLSQALQLHPDVLEYIISLNPHDFKRLRNPLMRKAMPPRISLARVAKMTDTPLLALLTRIHELAGEPLTAEDMAELKVRLGEAQVNNLPDNVGPTPAWIETEPTLVVDLLEHDARLDADPMLPIMKGLKQLNSGQVMLVKHIWEPQPLYDVWSKQGTAYFAQQKSSLEWWIYLRKG